MNRKYNPWVSLAALILLVVFLLTTCTGCTNSEATYEATYEQKTSMFVTVETTYKWKVVYHKDTKVMYVVSESSYNRGNFTLLVNADGSPMLWEE